MKDDEIKAVTAVVIAVAIIFLASWWNAPASESKRADQAIERLNIELRDAQPKK